MQKSRATALFVIGFLMCFVAPGLGVLVLLAAGWKLIQPQNEARTSHGSARLATLRDARLGGLLEAEGVILGRADLLGGQTRNRRQRRAVARLLKLRTHVHLATFAATGRGKGVGVLIPNLLSYRGSCVVTDPKGELARITGGFRRGGLGQRIYVLDPFKITEQPSDTLNPLDFIDDSAEDFLDNCRDLANMLVVRTGKETEPHWNDAAEMVLSAFIAFVCACEKNPQARNLQAVRGFLASRAEFARVVSAMQQTTTHDGVLSRLGHLLTWFVEKELASVLTTVQRHTAFLDSPAVARNTLRSSFDPRMLRSGNGATLYLCLPHDRLITLAPLQRMWLGTVLRVITRGGATEVNPVLFLIDEAGHIGHIRALEDAVTLMRGMGIRLWFFFQSLNQLKESYGDRAATILDNIDTQQYFGINCFESAEAISKRIGDATISVDSDNRSTSHSKTSGGGSPGSTSVSGSVSITRSQIARKVLFPDEILRLPEDVALIFHRSLPVVPATLPKYYEAPEFERLGEDATTDRRTVRGPLAPAVMRGMVWIVRWIAIRVAMVFVFTTIVVVGIGQVPPTVYLRSLLSAIGLASPTAVKPSPVPHGGSGAKPRPGKQPNRSAPDEDRFLRWPSPPTSGAYPPRSRNSTRTVGLTPNGSLSTRAAVAASHACFDPKWCPDPLHCPRLSSPRR